MNHFNVLLWLHALTMISVIGVLLCTQLAMTSDQRNSAESSRAVARLANMLLGIGFLLGISYYVSAKGYTLGPHYNGVIGVKFCFMLGAGALIGISKRTDNGDLLRWIAIALFVLASFFGITLS